MRACEAFRDADDHASGHEDCPRGSVDALSSSLVSRKAPTIFLHSRGATGLVVSPDVQLLCAFPADVGTGGAPQRPGNCGALHAEGYTGETLKEALEWQHGGRWSA